MYTHNILWILPKDSGNESSIGGTNHETGNEETTGDASSVSPTGDKEIHEENDPESGEREGTWIVRINKISPVYHMIVT